MLGALDTLQTVKRLKEAGFSDAQAETVTAILRDSRESDVSQLATKADLDLFIARTEADLDRNAAATKTDLALVRVEIETLGRELRAEMEILRRDLTIRPGGMIVVAPGILLAAKFFG